MQTICVRLPRSHRKYARLSIIGRPLQVYYSFRFEGNFAYVTVAEYEQLRPLVTKARVDESKLLQCWNG